MQQAFQRWAGDDRLERSDGPDHSSLKGAIALAKRLQDYWAVRGVDVRYDVCFAGYSRSDNKHDMVYGVRVHNPNASTGRPKKTPANARPLSPSISEKLTGICLEVLQRHPGVTLEDVMAPTKLRTLSRARHECMWACHVANVCSLTALGKFFKRNHGTVHKAVNSREAA